MHVTSSLYGFNGVSIVDGTISSPLYTVWINYFQTLINRGLFRASERVPIAELERLEQGVAFVPAHTSTLRPVRSKLAGVIILHHRSKLCSPGFCLCLFHGVIQDASAYAALGLLVRRRGSGSSGAGRRLVTRSLRLPLWQSAVQDPGHYGGHVGVGAELLDALGTARCVVSRAEPEALRARRPLGGLVLDGRGAEAGAELDRWGCGFSG
jgi:hypothetical protein